MNILKSYNSYTRLSISILILGILFKIMHWPFSWILLGGGALGIAVFYSIGFYFKNRKTLLDFAKLFLLISFLFHYSFHVFHLAYGYVFTLLFQLALVLLLFSYVRDVFVMDKADNSYTDSQSDSRDKKSSYLIYGTATLLILVGCITKILHWEFGFINGNVLLIFGLVIAAASILLGIKKNKK